ncbi:MAG: hypothetical protein R3E89_01600 [Thiolinea sp.]
MSDASFYHVDQMSQQWTDGNLALLFAPGLRVPDAVYASDQWHYFRYLLPSSASAISLFGRLKDVGHLRSLKAELGSVGMGNVNSLNIPVSFPGMRDSP